MNIRPKTVRRLAVLFAMLALFAGGVALLLVRSVRKEKATVGSIRDSAFRAYDRHDNASAVKLFGTYLNAGPAESNDAEAVFAYGMARSQVPMEGNRHFAEAINLLQKYLELDPADPHDASHQLLTLYWRARYNKEARSLADRLLAKNPRDVEALRVEAGAMINERNFADALTACQKLNQIDPANVVWQDRQLQLMAEIHQPIEQIVAHARKLVEAHPGDPRFHIVLAEGYGLANDAAKSQQEVETAAKLPPSDVFTALGLIAMVGRGSHPELADDLLARADAKFKDPSLEELSVRRLFEREQYAQLLSRLKAFDLKSPTASSNLLAYGTIALYRTGHRGEAVAMVATLAGRKDPISTAWAEAIHAHFAEPAIEPAAVIKSCNDAINRDRGNAIFPYFLADAHAELGETDEAIRDWNTAARLSPMWSAPVYRISRTLCSAGRYAEALIAVKELMRRAPGGLETQIAYSIAAWGRVQSNPAELHGPEGARLLKNFETIRARLPGEPETLPAYAALLNRRGEHDKAIGIVRPAIHSSHPLPEATFKQLLSISQEEHWGINAEILDAAERAYGLTPSIAYDRAIYLFRSGEQTQALQLADGARNAHANDVDWQLDDARFRDAIGQPDAAKRWTALCDAHPRDIRVQYAALSAPCRFSDRDLWQRTIDRVRSLTGQDGEAWQIEQARFGLSGNPSPEQVGAIIDSLQKLALASPELGEVHHLLAQALLLENKPEDLDKATAELKTVHDEQPDNFQVTSELAGLLVARGQRDAAAALVNAVSRDPNLDETRRLWAAQTDAELGDFDAGIRLLTTAESPWPLPNREPLLASLYLRAGQVDQAKALYTRIAADPSATPAGLSAAADFFATFHQFEAADQCVARLKELKLTRESAALLQSHLKELEGQPEKAAESLADACRADSHDQQLWAAWAGLKLRIGKLNEADTIAAAGLNAISSDPTLASMRARIAQLRSIDGADAALLLDPVSRDPRQPALEQFLGVLVEAGAPGRSPRQTAAALRPFADRYPRFFALQEILAGRYLAAQDPQQALAVAKRAVDVLPGDPQPLKLLTELQVAEGNWEGARATALRWRRSSLANPLEPDLAIARIDLQQPGADPASAAARLDPYVQDSAPEAHKLAALPLFCRSLLASGRVDEAIRQLQPLATKSPRWISVWMDLAASAKNAEIASHWLKALTPLIHPDSQAEQIGLADAWERTGTRFDSSSAQETARDILRPIIAGPAVPPAAWRVWALASQLSGDLPEAERAWQKLLDEQPKDPSAQNNLAYVLLLEDAADKLPRAESIARGAIAADPNAATFYDTLARIKARLGNRADAVHNFRIALQKDPNDVEAMIGLADELQSQPSGRDEARSLLSRIKAKVEAGVPLLQPVRKQLEHVTTALSASIGRGE